MPAWGISLHPVKAPFSFNRRKVHTLRTPCYFELKILLSLNRVPTLRLLAAVSHSKIIGVYLVQAPLPLPESMGTALH